MAVGGGTTVIRYDLVKHAVVTSVVSATQFVADGLVGYADGYFASSGIIVGWGLYVLRDIRTTSTVIAAPQGEQTFVTSSTQAGLVTHPAFTVPLIPGDEILILHPNISAAWIAALATQNVPAIDSLINLLLRDVVGNKADTPDIVLGVASSLMRYLKGVLAQVNLVVANVNPQVALLHGAVPVAAGVVANWHTGVATSGAAGADLVTIGGGRSAEQGSLPAHQHFRLSLGTTAGGVGNGQDVPDRQRR